MVLAQVSESDDLVSDSEMNNSNSFRLPLSNYTGTSYVETLSNSGTIIHSPAWFTNWSFASRVRIVCLLTFYTFIVSSIGKTTFLFYWNTK